MVGRNLVFGVEGPSLLNVPEGQAVSAWRLAFHGPKDRRWSVFIRVVRIKNNASPPTGPARLVGLSFLYTVSIANRYERVIVIPVDYVNSAAGE